MIIYCGSFGIEPVSLLKLMNSGMFVKEFMVLGETRI